MAMLLYENAMRTFPPARVKTPQYGHVPLLLPYIEEAGMAAAFDYTKRFDDPANQKAANTPLKIVLCPSTPTTPKIKMRKSSSTGKKYGDFITATGSTTDPTDTTILTGIRNDYWVNHQIDSTFYVAPDGTSKPTPLLSGELTLMSVKDGTSNTTMLVEHAGYDVHYVDGRRMPSTDLTLDQPGAWGTWVGWCAFKVQGYPAFNATNPYPTNKATPAGNLRAVNVNNSQGLYGFHPAGANVAMCDGSVQFLSTSTEVQVLLRLASKDGRENVTLTN